MQFLLTILILLAPTAQAANKLAEGICPFDESKIAANFTRELRHDYTDKYIAQSFQRREKWYGPCSAAISNGKDRFTLRYAEATIPFEVTMKAGKIEQYGFQKVAIESDSWEKFESFLKTKWPSGGFFASHKGTEYGVRANDLFYVGEGRVLPMMKALEQKIAAGELKNDQKVKLLDADKAQEIDDLAEQKEGFTLPIGELKDRIFSDLDRTASDMILRLVGPGELEEGHENVAPFLSRREAGWLMTLSPEEMAKLERGDARKAAAKLDRAKKIPPLPSERYDHLDKTGWKASAQGLCEALTSMATVPELKNGLGSRGFRVVHPDWKNAVFYAARDFGVAQTTWRATLPKADGSTCFSLILNSKETLDEGEVEEIHDRAVSLLIHP